MPATIGITAISIAGMARSYPRNFHCSLSPLAEMGVSRHPVSGRFLDAGSSQTVRTTKNFVSILHACSSVEHLTLKAKYLFCPPGYLMFKVNSPNKLNKPN